MIDPLAEVVTLLQPGASFSKVVNGAGPWHVSRSEAGRPFYSVILDGSLRLAVNGHEEMILETSDFVLIPSAYDFRMSSLEPAPVEDAGTCPVELCPGEFRIGRQDGPPDVRALVGYCVFGSTDAALLVSLLPQVVHVRGERRLATLVQLVDEESRQRRPGRGVILAHLLEVILIEALRSMKGPGTSPGLVRGLGDERLAVALRLMHERPIHPWTVAELATETALSRSAFFERFRRAVGVAPMEYLLHWRMALAKDLLRRKDGGVAEVAERVGYGSASTFSVAFARHVGLPPMRYARELEGGLTHFVSRARTTSAQVMRAGRFIDACNLWDPVRSLERFPVCFLLLPLESRQSVLGQSPSLTYSLWPYFATAFANRLGE